MSTDGERTTSLDDWEVAADWVEDPQDVPDREVETGFETNGEGSRTCLNCGAHVSAEFSRVCGDNQGRVHRCLKCANKDGLGGRAGKRDM